MQPNTITVPSKDFVIDLSAPEIINFGCGCLRTASIDSAVRLNGTPQDGFPVALILKSGNAIITHFQTEELAQNMISELTQIIRLINLVDRTVN